MTTKERIFVTGFCGQYMTVFVKQTLHFLLMKFGFIWHVKAMSSGTLLIRDKFLKFPFAIRRLVFRCAIIATVILIFILFITLLIKSNLPVIFFYFLERMSNCIHVIPTHSMNFYIAIVKQLSLHISRSATWNYCQIVFSRDTKRV
jgi:hypothetical protein